MDDRTYFQFKNISKVSSKNTLNSPQRKVVWSKIISVLDFKVHRTLSFNAEVNSVNFNLNKETNSIKKIFVKHRNQE